MSISLNLDQIKTGIELSSILFSTILFCLSAKYQYRKEFGTADYLLLLAIFFLVLGK